VKILIAEDDAVSRTLLEASLKKWGYEVITVRDGLEAWQALQGQDASELAVLDWMMPGMDGLEVCRKVREIPPVRPIHIILLTARGGRGDVVKGLEAGADDYITKPYDLGELRARVQVGVRLVELQHTLANRVRELEEALARVKQLNGLLPICSYCKKIRDDRNYWQQVEGYISKHSEVQFSHGICPDCYEKIIGPELEKLPPDPKRNDEDS
jgi:sigma-B regulation protein RsbU (phosphoserine phosphatase)